MVDEVALAPEVSATLGALLGLFLGGRRHIGRVVKQVQVQLQNLFSESLVTLVALEGLLVRVYSHVRFEMALRDGGVGSGRI